MVDHEKIRTVLYQLDPFDDEQWTADGFPRVEIVSGLLNQIVKRQDIINAAPDFSRENNQPKEAEIEIEEVDESEDYVDLPIHETSFDNFYPWLITVPKEGLEDVEMSLKNQSNKVSQEIKKLQDFQAQISRAVSLTRSRIKQMFPNSAENFAIRQFIDSQNAARAARIGRRNEILKGISVSDFESRSPLDAALARKTKRGTARPTRLIMK